MPLNLQVGGVFLATEATDAQQPAGTWTAMGFPGATPAHDSSRVKDDIPLACDHGLP